MDVVHELVRRLDWTCAWNVVWIARHPPKRVLNNSDIFAHFSMGTDLEQKESTFCSTDVWAENAKGVHVCCEGIWVWPPNQVAKSYYCSRSSSGRGWGNLIPGAVLVQTWHAKWVIHECTAPTATVEKIGLVWKCWDKCKKSLEVCFLGQMRFWRSRCDGKIALAYLPMFHPSE